MMYEPVNPLLPNMQECYRGQASQRSDSGLCRCAYGDSDERGSGTAVRVWGEAGGTSDG